MKPSWGIFALTLPLLQACQEPQFQFRGITDRSTCQAAIDSELDRGARLDGAAVNSAVYGGQPGTVTKLKGQFGSTRVDIWIVCDGKTLRAAHYFAAAPTLSELEPLYRQMSQDLRQTFGPTRCDDKGLVDIKRIDPRWQGYDVGILVIPHKTVC